MGEDFYTAKSAPSGRIGITYPATTLSPSLEKHSPSRNDDGTASNPTIGLDIWGLFGIKNEITWKWRVCGREEEDYERIDHERIDHP